MRKKGGGGGEEKEEGEGEGEREEKADALRKGPPLLWLQASEVPAGLFKVLVLRLCCFEGSWSF